MHCSRASPLVTLYIVVTSVEVVEVDPEVDTTVQVHTLSFLQEAKETTATAAINNTFFICLMFFGL